MTDPYGHEFVTERRGYTADRFGGSGVMERCQKCGIRRFCDFSMNQDELAGRFECWAGAGPFWMSGTK